MNTDEYQTFITQLSANLQAEPKVIGLVLLGSTADQSHAPDAWSDHDFFVITRSGAQEDYRARFDWLPDHDSIVLTVRETAHGLKVLYRSGHLLEYAVFDLDEVGVAKANDYVVAFDGGGVADALARIAVTRAPAPLQAATIRRDLGMALCLLAVGAGRVARGEIISGQVFIRAYAAGHLLSLLAAYLPAPDKSALDTLDPLRRFERVFPAVGAQVNAALLLPPIPGALALLDVVEAHLHDHPDYRAEAVATVRDVLHRANAYQP